jgi:hypothetical protein
LETKNDGVGKKLKDINFQHIYRDHNKEVDALSKRELNEVEGRLSVFHWDNGKESPTSFINIFER